jgi:hypothetical protein
MNDTPSSANGQTLRDRTPVAVTVDNIIRRRLRVGDPSSPREVADGLRRLFAADSRSLDLEAKGLPLLPATMGPPPAVAAEANPSGTELDQASSDIERDLKALTTDSQLKDIEPELQGWSQAIRGIMADGIAAARTALDPRARDRAMGARRQLGDYARLARFMGALSCIQNQEYRRLAQSLDEVSALILVLIGESLARIGFGGGRFLLQAPASELQARRDAVIMALRNLNGSTQDAYGPSDWPYGLDGLRKVLRLLDDSGHSDLRALFDENSIGRLMDDLLDRAATVNAWGLRALGATAAVSVQRLNRLVQLVDNRVTPGSPPLVTFLDAVRLFVDGFEAGSSGYRLLFIARPPAVFYGLYGIGGPDDPTRRLIALVEQRGRLAELLDCYMTSGCCEGAAFCQVILDKILYDTDRAIDLYALGADSRGDGEPEWRAAAYGLLINAFLSPTMGTPLQQQLTVLNCLSSSCLPSLGSLGNTLRAIRDAVLSGNLPIGSPPGADSVPRRNAMQNELCLQRRMDQQWGSLLGTMAPACVGGNRVLTLISLLLDNALALAGSAACPAEGLPVPPTLEESVQILDELRRNPLFASIVARKS